MSCQFLKPDTTALSTESLDTLVALEASDVEFVDSMALHERRLRLEEMRIPLERALDAVVSLLCELRFAQMLKRAQRVTCANLAAMLVACTSCQA